MLELLRSDLCDIAESSAARVIEQYLGRPQALANQIERRLDLRAVSDIGGHFQRDAARAPDFIRQRAQVIGVTRVDRDRVLFREPARQRGPESRPDSSHQRNRQLL